MDGSPIKPMLACDWNPEKVKLPVMLQPKIDGVRGCHLLTGMTGRSLKKHGNKYTTEFYSAPEYVGFDGELAAESETHPDLCRLTTSAVNTYEGTPFTQWHLFDYVTPMTVNLPYIDRYKALSERVTYHQTFGRCPTVKLVPYYMVTTMEQLECYRAMFLEMGYEGTIGRDPFGKVKMGRATVREGGLWRIKDFIEEEAYVLEVEEGNQNDNLATINELGKTTRSTHQAGMIPNGMVGTLKCIAVKDGKEITVSCGNLTHPERRVYFVNQELIIGKIIKYKHFPKGVKDKPRFPTFVCIRAESDL